MKHINDHLAATITAEKYATLFYAVLNTRSKKFHYANAGHNYPMLFRDGETRYLSHANLIVGAKAGIDYKEEIVSLQSGDLLLFYTDGVSEVTDAHNELYGEERLREKLEQGHHQPLDTLLKAIHEDVTRFANSDHLPDDLTIVLLRLR